MSNQKSHLSEGKGTAEAPPMNQHKRLALGEKVSGQDNPHGGTPSTANKIANGSGKRY